MRPSPSAFLRRAGVDTFLVTDLVNIRYLTGISMSAGVLLVTSRRLLLFADARYKDRAQRTVREGVTVRDVGELPRLLKGVGECGFEADKVTVARRGSWKKNFPNIKFVQTAGLLEGFRRQKSDEELRLLRRAQRFTKELLRRVPSVLRPGITEERLARQLGIWALELGADGLAFDPIVAFGTHTGNPHHEPTSRALAKGHLVQVDVGAKVRGYCADMSRVFFTAKPTSQQQHVYETLALVQEQALRSAKAGVTNHALDAAARKTLREHGIDDEAFPHALGHGVGLEIHEGVTLSQRRTKEALLPGEVVTIEPGVYFPGTFGMRIEDMAFVA
jgi:Xaa-Pro aminopeptidase